MNMPDDIQLREQLVKHIKGGEAFTTIDSMLDKIPYTRLGETPGELPYSFYQLFYHIRFAQRDILVFCYDAAYTPPKWPEGYWPDTKAPRNEQDWESLKKAYFKERNELCTLIMDPSQDLITPFTQGSGQNLLREALLVIEHSAYHTGQLLILLRLMDLQK
jgi:uncharacterized damage-inducible protein DinB